MLNQKACIESERLLLLALSFCQLEIYGSHMACLGRQLGIRIPGDNRPIEALHAVDLILEKMCLSPAEAHLWLTYWLIIIKSEAVGAGVVGFQGPPDRYGRVIIGYGIDPSCQRRGYMTEALKTMAAWAFVNPACKIIVAEVLQNNFASIRVLEKAGARRVKTYDSLYRYFIRRPKP
ncbi:MAG: GNAT family N-acetyltransferase [Anaerolineae bacterium]|nr:GNAT family N-acetyltransferase [Anaerolineae bacterium]